ncbi:ornithine carbamoyltransferase [Aquifex aeolicus]|uniref:Ornithine carbamoyltransferase n=1 Tax=Aquifex aeolicus (strain VF5) TaxID=224324 RepID=OTC_AQUAE|nr:ornithine carbamoyltransferase [Aquifex aeolicus]O67607.1 RecName: Full=Ornithine carbamoyltransferase; Short=OTCase [Aquifex aeolicus VF5]AAC07566.1 ornithine carbamoyltransferase [Aquifex aeolicus VF5]
MKRDFVDLWDLSPKEAWEIVKKTLKVKKGEEELGKPLSGKTIALLFTKPSTRTRVSFEVGIYQLGGNSLFFQEKELQVSRGEDVRDTARTLSKYVDGVIVRNHSHTWLKEFANFASVPVINALTNMSHPCQILSDVFTLYEHYGEELKNLKVAYVGDGNNVCNTLMVGAGMFGLKLFVATPEGYEPNSYYYKKALEFSKENGGSVELTNNPVESVKDADVVYTDVWVSMGEENKNIEAFLPYQVNEKLLSFAKSSVKVMHCLPAKKGQEITEEVFEKNADFIFTQAENRLHTQKTLMEFLFREPQA